MKGLGAILAKVNRKFKTNLSAVEEDDERTTVAFRTTTGIPQLDLSLGGGLPCGRIVEISGEEGAGKTTLETQLISANPGTSVLHDVEGTFSAPRASQMGFDLSRLVYDALGEESSAETILDSIEAILSEIPKPVEEGDPLVFFIDSIAALMTEQEEAKTTKESVVASLARVLSRGLKKLSKRLSMTRASLVVINQLRDKIDAGPAAYGKQQDSVGGRALKFYSSVRLFLTVVKRIVRKRTVKLPDGSKTLSEVEGVKVKIKAIKNKVFRPFLECEFALYFDDRGIDWGEGLVEFLIRYGVLVGRKGSTAYTLHPLALEAAPELADLGEMKPAEIIEIAQADETYDPLMRAALAVLSAGRDATAEGEVVEDEEPAEDE